MNAITPNVRNWFDQGGDSYARFRPDYPPELAAFLSSKSPNSRLALDVGCGSGQLSLQLAKRFTTVVGLDPSAEQLASAERHERVRYQCAPAEQLPLPDNCVSLVAAAQAAHWFDLGAFYEEVRRVTIDKGVVALVSYGVLSLESDFDDLFKYFYWEEMGRYWPAQRQLVDSGYATLSFPFDEIATPKMEICLYWSLSQLLGYISTWSAVRQAKEGEGSGSLQAFGEKMGEAWGDPSITRPVTWPINMRVGTL